MVGEKSRLHSERGKIYDFGNCKATATANKRRKLVLSPVNVSYPLQSFSNPFSARAHVTMIKRAEKPSAHIEVIPARPEQESILANLLELYAHDFSEFHDLELGADGRFGYHCLPLYWSEPGRHPFLVWVEGKLAGLVLV